MAKGSWGNRDTDPIISLAFAPIVSSFGPSTVTRELQIIPLSFFGFAQHELSICLLISCCSF